MDRIPAAWDSTYFSDSSIVSMLGRFTNDSFGQARAYFTYYGQVFNKHLAEAYPNIEIIAYNGTNPPLVDPSIQPYQLVYLTDPKVLATITPTAEHTLGLLMATDRNHRASWEGILREQYNRYDHSAPKMLSQSKLTIIGMGRIGQMLFKMAKPLFAHIYTIDEQAWNDSEDIVETLGQTDFLAICASYDPLKGPIVTKGVLDLLPYNAVVVNTSHGENINNMALLQALKDKRIRAAALDVLPDDHKPWDNLTSKAVIEYARDHRNLILTPHLAGSTEDAWDITQQWVIKEVYRRLIGAPTHHFFAFDVDDADG